MQPYPQGSGSPLARSPAWHGLSQCTGNQHWGSYCWVVLVFRFAFRGNAATPGWGLGCVRLGEGFDFPPPFLAGFWDVGVCAWARVFSAPRHSWLGCWGVCAFVCALHFYPKYPGWGVRCGCVCLGSGLRCALPLLAGVLGRVCRCAPSACTPPFLARLLACVCVCVRASPVPRQSWPGCLVLPCVLGLGFRLRPATPS